MQVTDLYTMTGSPEDEITVLEAINQHLVECARGVVAENRRLRDALTAIEHEAMVWMECWQHDDNAAARIAMNQIKWIATRELRNER
jgi:hypothetical protein